MMRIGCSGWNYTSWRGRFYPKDLPVSRWLGYYQDLFDTVEVNNTFYRLPDAATFAAWRRQTHDGFLMSVKASRYLTHLKRLVDPEEPVHRLFARVASLGARLGPVLYQLPPTLTLDVDRLASFLDALPRTLPARARPRTPRRPIRHVIEFRHASWYVDEVFQVLAARGVAICLHDKPGSAFDDAAIGPFVYVRFHGPTGRYGGCYTDEALAAWARKLAAARRRGRDVFAYFNNDVDGFAVRNAQTLRRFIGAPRAFKMSNFELDAAPSAHVSKKRLAKGA
jgi:uncharacterized protein YecE (DUF72 family)